MLGFEGFDKDFKYRLYVFIRYMVSLLCMSIVD